MTAVGGSMQPFRDPWEAHTMGADPWSWRRPVRVYRVDYQAGAESGRVTLRTDAHLPDTLATQARAALEARGIEAAIRWVMPVEDRPRRAARRVSGRD